MFKSRSKLGRLRAALRQWRYPAEFRIPEAAWSEELAESLAEILSRAPAVVAAGSEAQRWNEDDLIAIGTRLWRLRNELTRNEAEDSSSRPLRQAARHVEVLWDRLAEAGLEIYDHTGELMPEGIYLLKVLAHQPTSRVTSNRVIETVKPTIRFNKKIIQVGEVIVGTPEKAN